MNKALYISFLLLISFGAVAQRKDKNKEESLKEQSLDDIEALSSKDFPYIEKFHEALREKMAGNLEEAKKLFKECLEERQDDDAVYFGLGEIARDQKMKSEALSHFKKAQSLDPENIYYTQEVAYIQYERADFEEAVSNFAKLVEHEPRNVDWIYGYGQVLVYSKQYKKAIEVFTNLQDQVGTVPEIMIMKADLYKEIDEIDKAENTLLELRSEFPQNREVLKTVIGFYEEQGEQQKAIELVEELSIAEPNNSAAHFIMANEYARKGDRESFINSLRVVIGSKEIEMSDKMSLLKYLYTIPGISDSLILDLSKSLVDTHKDDPEALTFRAEALSQSGQSKEALIFYRQALQNNTGEFRLWTSVLGFESAHKDYEALYEDAKEAISFFPSLPFVYYSAAEGALYTDRLDEALDFLTQGELYLLDDKTQKARFDMRRGQIYFEQEKYTLGMDAFNKALSIDPDAEIIKINYAHALANSEKNLDNASDLLSSVKPEKRGSDYYYTSAYLALKKGDVENGIEILKEGIEKLSYTPELHDLLGDLYILSEQPNEAVEEWKKAKKLESRNTLLDKKIKERVFYAPQYY